MNLYVGGAGQGKTEYVLRKLQKEPILITGKDWYNWLQTESEDEKNQPIVITHLEAYTRNALQEMQDQEDPENAISTSLCTQLDSFMHQHPDVFIICNEIGNGIVPMDPAERLWREVTGRVLIHLAKEADHFERVIAGMGQVIK